jgi:hypothetical protein
MHWRFAPTRLHVHRVVAARWQISECWRKAGGQASGGLRLSLATRPRAQPEKPQPPLPGPRLPEEEHFLEL